MLCAGGPKIIIILKTMFKVMVIMIDNVIVKVYLVHLMNVEQL